jgi:peptidoglycan/LPS O-acetylase OafA/YrhL
MERREKKIINFLDGYRGFLAIIVTLHHIGCFFFTGDVVYFRLTGYFIGVVGFFVLSSFLLTHRLMIDFERAESGKKCMVRVIQYAIRRFFRIYLVVIIYWSLAHFGPKIFNQGIIPFPGLFHTDFVSGMVFLHFGHNHLWTIPVEIKYYFFIPIISFLSVKSGKYWFVLWSLSTAFMIYVEIYNPFHFSPDDYEITVPDLSPRFTMFFAGSQLAIIYFHFEKMPTVRELTIKPITRRLFSISLNILFIGQFLLFSTELQPGLKFFEHSFVSAIYQIGIIFMLLYVNDANPVAKLYSTSYLRTSGYYSFGIYLLHLTIIHIVIMSKDYIPIAYHHYIFKFGFQRAYIVVQLTYFAALIWFRLIENQLIKIANKLSKLIESKLN